MAQRKQKPINRSDDAVRSEREHGDDGHERKGLRAQISRIVPASVRSAAARVAGSMSSRFGRSEERREEHAEVVHGDFRPNEEQAQERTTRRRTADFELSELESRTVPQQNRSPGLPSRHGHDYVDQEAAVAMSVEDRWNDEDRLTNRTSDPRIGTRGRTYVDGVRKSAESERRDNPPSDTDLPDDRS